MSGDLVQQARDFAARDIAVPASWVRAVLAELAKRDATIAEYREARKWEAEALAAKNDRLENRDREIEQLTAQRDEAVRLNEVLHALIEGRMSNDLERPFGEGEPLPYSLALSCRQFAAVLKDAATAENYIQLEWYDSMDDRSYCLVMQYADKKSPVVLQKEAERERDEARDLLRRAREYVEPGDLADRIAEALGEPRPEVPGVAPTTHSVTGEEMWSRVDVPADAPAALGARR